MGPDIAISSVLGCTQTVMRPLNTVIKGFLLLSRLQDSIMYYPHDSGSVFTLVVSARDSGDWDIVILNAYWTETLDSLGLMFTVLEISSPQISTSSIHMKMSDVSLKTVFRTFRTAEQMSHI